MPDAKEPERASLLDERLLNTPSIALERCHIITSEMAKDSISCFKEAMLSIGDYNPQYAESVRKKEDQTDRLEDVLGTYLVNLSSRQISERDSMEAAKLLKIIGDFERIADHAVNIIRSVEELRQKNLNFTADARKELSVLSRAVNETVDITLKAYLDNDLDIALKVEPLEHVVDLLKEQLRTNHIVRLQKGSCSIDVGFVWSDLLTNIERVSDHCSNIAGCIIDIAGSNMNLHESLRRYRHDSDGYRKMLTQYISEYSLDTLKG
ncbi:MAG: PhoU domain-containing protein [bacterium]|nr:PhoU domain-containing protein [bacterium]